MAHYGSTPEKVADVGKGIEKNAKEVGEKVKDSVGEGISKVKEFGENVDTKKFVEKLKEYLKKAGEMVVNLKNKMGEMVHKVSESESYKKLQTGLVSMYDSVKQFFNSLLKSKSE